MKKKNLLLSFALLSSLSVSAQKINVVTDLAHEFSFFIPTTGSTRSI